MAEDKTAEADFSSFDVSFDDDEIMNTLISSKIDVPYWSDFENLMASAIASGATQELVDAIFKLGKLKTIKAVVTLLSVGIADVSKVEYDPIRFENVKKLDPAKLNAKRKELKLSVKHISPFNIIPEVRNCPNVKFVGYDQTSLKVEVNGASRLLPTNSHQAFYDAAISALKDAELSLKRHDYRISPYNEKTFLLSIIFGYWTNVEVVNGVAKYSLNKAASKPLVHEEDPQLVKMAEKIPVWFGSFDKVLPLLDEKLAVDDDATKPYHFNYLMLNKYVKDNSVAYNALSKAYVSMKNSIGIITGYTTDAERDAAVAIMSKQNIDEQTPKLMKFLTANRDWRNIDEESDEYTHDISDLYALFHLGSDDWGSVHRMEMIARVISDLKSPNYLLWSIFGDGANDVVDALQYSEYSAVPKIIHVAGDAITVPHMTKSAVPMTKPAGKKTEKANAPDVRGMAAEAGESTLYVMFNHAWFTDSSSDDAGREAIIREIEFVSQFKTTGLLVVQNISKSENFTAMLDAAFNAHMNVRFYRHPRLHNMAYYMYFFKSPNITQELTFWDDAYKFRVDHIKSIYHNNSVRNLFIASGFKPWTSPDKNRVIALSCQFQTTSRSKSIGAPATKVTTVKANDAQNRLFLEAERRKAAEKSLTDNNNVLKIPSQVVDAEGNVIMGGTIITSPATKHPPEKNQKLK